MNSALSDLSLDIDLPPRARVVVAMSGGVDSAVAAAVLKEADYDVVGLTMRLYDSAPAAGRVKTCCAGRDIYDAARAADHLGIPHYVVDYKSQFMTDVMEAFADSYVNGETPIPCVLCNQTVKFRDLLQEARGLGATAIATGHYVRRVRTASGAVALWRGADHRRDQSYFLFATTRAQLELLRFPLGRLSKRQVRAIAHRHDLMIADKPDSQDICFAPDGDYAKVVSELRPNAAVPGPIKHVDGTILGFHKGIIHYTVGQRRGLDIGGLAHRLYVVRLDPESRTVVVGPRECLGQRRFLIRAVNWLGDDGPSLTGERQVQVRVRNSAEPVAGAVVPREQGWAETTLEQLVSGVAPGQACVLYQGERVVGGGWIATSAHGDDPPLTAVSEVASKQRLQTVAE